MPVPPLVVVDHLTKRFGGTTAVDDISFAVAPGEIFGFLGPNGAGKTTTIKILTGLLRPTTGRATICGFDITSHPVEAKRLFGYVPDEPALYPKLTALEFLSFVGDMYAMNPARKQARIRELLSLFELRADAGALLESYSHGMRQKVALCAALLHDPKIYFLDEPTVGLDPKSARMLKDIVRALTRAGGAVMMSTHIMEIAESLCDRVAIIDHGRIAAIGTVSELRELRGRDTLEEVFLHLTGGFEDHRIAEIFREPARA
ncbi:MAG: ABC transporter ATP-binding protein [Candidatus Eremiobacteraeota bacterium]|nr:ABC transporter ATP-binding protein [Candidatus Eremiobacteraeota bacterium]MBV8364919.1 ABC transporter ATP-binding protein [Candidatus Eremiobacteraeota bacterium]